MLRRTLRILNQCWGALTERIAFRFAKTIVVPSQGLARELKSAYPKLVPGKIRVIPNPVDTGAFARASDFSDAGVRDQLGIPRSALVLSFCALGNFGWKGLAIVLDALSGVPAVPVHLIVIGGSRDEVREYEAIVERLGIARTVHFVGLQNDIRPYLWASNAFIFPSIYETFPLVCLQAAAAGLPLITTPLYGVEEFMADGVTGWIVERTSGSIAFAIHSATIDRQRTAQMGQQAKERVQMYSVNRFRARWLELLDEEFEALAVRDQQRYA